MPVRKKPGQAGEVKQFISRNQSLRRLQLSLRNFRRLCILKGIYPHEPKHPKKLNKGNSERKTWYLTRDVKYLANENIITKFRQLRVFARRLKRAEGRRDWESFHRARVNKPTFTVDHIIRERYPSFADCVRDLDDCLTMIALFSTIPKNRAVNSDFISFCRRVYVEFLHVIVASRMLRKVFVSIKGVYYQANVFGADVTWIAPHSVAYQPPSEVDFRLMLIFVEFWATLLGFVNFKLYCDANLAYPPQLQALVKSEPFLAEKPRSGEEKKSMPRSEKRAMKRAADKREALPSYERDQVEKDDAFEYIATLALPLRRSGDGGGAEPEHEKPDEFEGHALASQGSF